MRRSAARAGASGTALPVVAPAAGAKAWPHEAQKRASDRFSAPQLGHADANGEPQLSQNRLPVRFSVPQAEQRIGSSW
jgi:hypothetical protein